MADTKIPSTRSELVDFYEAHSPIWEANAAAVGLSVALVGAVKAATDLAVANRADAVARRNAAKLSTNMYYDAADALRTVGGAAVATIRAFAEATEDPTVYDTAKLSPPAPPTPAGPPTAPTDFSADPNADGTISLKWKGTVANGQTFDIERSIDGGPWVLIKNRRGKKYLDNAVPTNISSVTYRVWGVRDTVRSVESASTQVLFGNLPPALQAAFRSGPVSEAA